MPYFGIPIRNGLPIGLGSVAGFGVQQFSPADLFSAGEQGAWYDPSDLTTLFDDSAGTTPVTAPGNGADVWVGLMLDKSKGLVLGPELVTNGNFSSGTTTGWTGADAVLSVVSGQLGVTPNDNFTRTAYQSFSVTAGRTYVLQFNYNQNTATTLRYFAGTSLGSGSDIPLTVLSGSGFVTRYFTATGSTLFIQFGAFNSAGLTALFDNFTVRELPGNHATQTSTTKRPKLAARYNLLTYSEQFDNAVWNRFSFLAFGSGSVVNAIAAPNGTVTADLLTESTAVSANFYFNQSTALSASTSYTYSIYCKPNGRSRLYLAGSSTAWGAGFITYNLNTGVVSPSSGSGWTGTIENLPDGWYRITATRTTNAGISGGYVLSLFFLDNAGNVTYTGDGVSGMYFWGADLRPASQATGLIGPTYQRVVDAATYDTVGFLPYLEFNGLSWSMSTNSIDFSAVPTDKMTVWAGVRKLSDALDGLLCELSIGVAGAAGSFYLATPESAALISYAFLSRGTAAASAAQRASTVLSAYPAPITNVLSATGNIAGDLSTIRVNGVAGTNATGDQGAGNYGNYLLFIGSRAGTSVFFNGWLTSLIVRGAQSTQSQIEATESWVNGKTGAYV